MALYLSPQLLSHVRRQKHVIGNVYVEVLIALVATATGMSHATKYGYGVISYHGYQPTLFEKYSFAAKWNSRMKSNPFSSGYTILMSCSDSSAVSSHSCRGGGGREGS